MSESPPKITMLDEYVRRSILSYPSIFPTRLRVLCHVFLTLGNGVRWKANGTFSLRELDTEMKYDDLETRMERTYGNDGFYQDKLDDEVVLTMKARMQEGIDQDRALRQRIAANIYEIATTKLPDDFVFEYGEDGPKAMEIWRAQQASPTGDTNTGGHYEEADRILHYVQSGYLNVGPDMPKRVEQSHFDGAIEILDAVIRSTENETERKALSDYRDSLSVGRKIYDGGMV